MIPIPQYIFTPDELETPNALFKADMLVTPVPPLARGKVPLVISFVEWVCEVFALVVKSSVVANVFPLMKPLVAPMISLLRELFICIYE